MDILLQDYKGINEMDATSNRFKLIAYDYDLISGRVNGVSYQPGKADAFYHHYEYACPGHAAGRRSLLVSRGRGEPADRRLDHPGQHRLGAGCGL